MDVVIGSWASFIFMACLKYEQCTARTLKYVLYKHLGREMLEEKEVLV